MSSPDFPFGWAGLLAQGPAAAFLRRALSSGRLPHALLFWGPRGVGKRTAAKILAAAALCQARRPPLDEACGSCQSCRELASGVNADLIEPVVREKHGGGETARDLSDEDREITLNKTISPLLDRVALRASRGDLRVVLLPRAERMNEVCQNTLLKSLEEPPGPRLWILTAEDPSRLLATVRSRLCPVRFGRLPTKTIAQELAARGLLAGPEAEGVALAAEGSFSRAVELVSEAWAENRRFLEEMVLSRVGSGSHAGPGMARALIERTAALAGRRDATPRGDEESEPGGDEAQRPSGLEPRRRAALGLLEALSLVLRERLLDRLSRTDALVDGDRRPLRGGPVPTGPARRPGDLISGIEVALASGEAIGQNVRVELVLSAAAAALACGEPKLALSGQA